MLTACGLIMPPPQAPGHHVLLLDIDESVLAELVVGILAARHVAAFARASIHCAALAMRALEFDGLVGVLGGGFGVVVGRSEGGIRAGLVGTRLLPLIAWDSRWTSSRGFCFLFGEWVCRERGALRQSLVIL